MKLATVGKIVTVERFIQSVFNEGSFELTTVFSRTPGKAEVLAAKYHIPRFQSDWMAFVNDPEIEVVFLATPTDTHFDLAKDLLRAKKHVIMEKPFVSHSQELKKLIKIAKANDRYVFDAIIPIHLPNFAILKKSLNQIGHLRVCNFSMVQYSSSYPALLNNEEPSIFSLKNSGGALMDLGVYPITILAGLFGVPNHCSYLCNKHANGIDVSGVITLTYPDFIAVATVAKDTTGLNFMTFNGDKAYLKADKAPSSVSQVLLVEKDKNTELGIIQQPLTMSYEIKDFYEVIANHDDKRYLEWMKITEMAFKVLDDCRKQAGLVFAADGVK